MIFPIVVMSILVVGFAIWALLDCKKIGGKTNGKTPVYF